MMKLTALKIRKWSSLPNQLEIECEDENGQDVTFQCVPKDSLFEAVFLLVRDEITNEMSKMFEDLTGEGTPGFDLELPEGEPFLDTDEDLPAAGSI